MIEKVVVGLYKIGFQTGKNSGSFTDGPHAAGYNWQSTGTTDAMSFSLPSTRWLQCVATIGLHCTVFDPNSCSVTIIDMI